MRVSVLPSSVRGTVAAQPSKSHAQRVIAIAALANGTSEISGAGSSDDVHNALNVIKALGAEVNTTSEVINITGGRSLSSHIWHCGESGLGIRMFCAIAGLFDTEIHLTAEGSLSSRDMNFMASPFTQLGVSFASSHGFPPLKIKGPYKSNSVVMDGSASSQFLTGLLIALPNVHHDTLVEVRNLKSKPYIDLTLTTIQEFGVTVSHENHEKFKIAGGQKYKPASIRIGGDWSGMSFMFVAAALSGEVSVTGLPDAGSQADGRILEALTACGAFVSVQREEIIVRHHDLQPFEFDCTHCPDLFPPLAALASHCNGISRIAGVHRLRSKESDRGEVLVSEFSKLGVGIRKANDHLVIEGGHVQGGVADARGDHRIAMALATAALKSKGPVTISGAECVTKSYPGFFEDLASIGGDVQYLTDRS